jgi:hypothetical protein
MKNKILLLAFIFIFSSCSILIKNQTVSQNIETSEIEPEDSFQNLLGNYDIVVFDTPLGNIEFNILVELEGENLKSSFIGEEASNNFDILSTEVDEGILYINTYVKSYGANISFEIYVEGDQVTGYLADMFELQGVKYSSIESDDNIPENISSLIIGDYNITVYDVPGYGDIDVRIKIFLNKNILDSNITYFNGESWVDVTVNSIDVEDEAVFINVVDEEAGNVDLEIYFDDQNSISGFYAGLFDFSGKRIN